MKDKRKRVSIILGVIIGVLALGVFADVLSGKENTPNYSTESEQTDSIGTETETIQQPVEAGCWVKDLDIAQTTTQMIVVSAKGSYATVSMHTQNDDGSWEEQFSVLGRIGRKGVGKEREGDEKTPAGVYHFTKAFGILENPGITTLPYLQIDETHYWVDDSDSKYYNQMVSTCEVKKDWKSAEKLIESIYSYKYVLALNYNEDCAPGAGSAIFLHCPSRDFEGTSGCIAIPIENMVEVMQSLQSDCVIIIDNEENIANY